jgi:hypothetical protein
VSWGPEAWADPTTPTQPGPAYAGPPPTAPPYPGPYTPYGYAAPPYGYGYGYGQAYGQPYAAWPPGPPSPWAARGPQRPGQALAASVLAYVQTGLVLVASLYLWFFSSVADAAFSGVGGVDASTTVRGLASEGATLALVQLVSAGLLVAGGVTALNRRTPGARLLLLAAHAVQVTLAAYWTVRLLMLLGDIPGDDPVSPVLILTLFFAAGPAVALGLLLTGPGRRWFDGTPRA